MDAQLQILKNFAEAIGERRKIVRVRLDQLDPRQLANFVSFRYQQDRG